MIEIEIDGVRHAAKPVGPEVWRDRGPDGSTKIAAHVLYCDPTRYVGTLNVYGKVVDHEGLCPECLAIVGRQIEKRLEYDARRAAGQPTNICERLDQGVWWQVRDGSWIKIEDMEPSHAANAANFMMKRARRYAFAYAMMAAMTLPNEDECGDMTWDAVNSAQDHLDRETSENPAAWLRTTTLYKELLARGSAIEDFGVYSPPDATAAHE